MADFGFSSINTHDYEYKNPSPDYEEKDFASWISDGFETIYNTDPAAANYFLVNSIYDPFKEIDLDKDEIALFRNFTQSISFSNDLGIEFDTQKINRGQNYYTINKLNRIPSVTIDYFNDAPRTMFHYHKNWVDAWYSAAYNCVSVGAKSKFRNMDILFFRMTNNGPKVYAEATLVNMVPSNIGKIFEASYSQPGNSNTYKVTYTIDRVEFKFSNSQEGLSDIQKVPFTNLGTDDIKLDPKKLEEKDIEDTNLRRFKRY